jgi:hypothetical protein
MERPEDEQMNDRDRAPVSTRPEGNTDLRPSVQEVGLAKNVAKKLREDHPDQNRRMAEFLKRKNVHAGR